jgi:predicted NBD/HSP70 family sugar kinase
LEEQGLIEVFNNSDESEDDLIKKGRRPVAYTTRSDALYTVGLEFWVSYVSIGIFNFRGNRIFSRVESLRKNIDVTETIAFIVKLVREALSCLNIPVEKVPGICVAAPGQVDIANRTVINYARISGMQDYPLAVELEKLLGITVIVHNNCSAMALSEYRYGGYEHQGSMFTFLLRSGVGGAYVDEQGIYTSELKTLEPGHMSINYGGPLCYCGTRGCLQAYLMELDSAYNEQEGKLLFNALEQKLANHNTEAEKIISKAAEYLFVAMKNIMRFFSPRSFLILSNGELISRCIADHIKQCWQDEPDTFVSIAPLIFSNTCNPLISQQGASDLVISYYFS